MQHIHHSQLLAGVKAQERHATFHTSPSESVPDCSVQASTVDDCWWAELYNRLVLALPAVCTKAGHEHGNRLHIHPLSDL